MVFDLTHFLLRTRSDSHLLFHDFDIRGLTLSIVFSMASPSLSVAEEEIENFIPPGNLRLLQLHFDFTTNLLFTWGLVATSFCLLTFHIFNAQGKAFPGIPVVGRTGWFEPIWRTRLRFIKGCGSLCYDGFTKVRCSDKHSPSSD